MSIDLSTFEKEEHYYLTTRGCVTGNPHESVLYLISGGGTKSDCVKTC